MPVPHLFDVSPPPPDYFSTQPTIDNTKGAPLRCAGLNDFFAFFRREREATPFTPSHELLNFVWTLFLSTEGVTEMGATESGFRIHA